MSLRITFGVDPGLSGAISMLADGEFAAVLDMPTRLATKTGTRMEVDDTALAKWVREQWQQHPGAWPSACIERVGAVPMEGRRQGTSSSFNFGEGAGVVRAVFATLGIAYIRVAPAQWKRYYGLIGTEKDAARQLAIARFPSMTEQLKRKKDGGRADATLLALWYESVEMRGNRAA